MRPKQDCKAPQGRAEAAHKPRISAREPAEGESRKVVVERGAKGGVNIENRFSMGRNYIRSEEIVADANRCTLSDFLSDALGTMEERELKVISEWVKEREKTGRWGEAPKAALERLLQAVNGREAKTAEDGKTVILGRLIEKSVRETGSYTQMGETLRAYVDFRL